MNCYDFDQTIYRGDSSRDFFLFCLIRHKKILRRLPEQIRAFFRCYVLHSIDKTQMKETFYSYFADIPDINNVVLRFWNQNVKKIKRFYREQKRDDDVIISASPDFFLRPVCQKIGIMHLIASQVDAKTGQYAGQNCHGAEKVRRFRDLYPDAVVDRFYSDSHSDEPMARLARQAYLVRGKKISAWRL